MAVTPVSKTIVDTAVTYSYVGKSTDEKPTAPNGSTFRELDTDATYYFDSDEQDWFTQAEKYLTEIKITTAPTKVSYVEGDEFDATGMVVKAYYTNDTNGAVVNYTIDAPEHLSVSDTKVTITYKENGRTRTAEQAITVVPVALASIAFSTDPTTTTYSIGDALDLTGAVVTATYNNNDTADVTESCTFSPANGATLTAEDTSVTASYTEGDVTKTASVSITVS